jgi:hypothetical protein
MRVAANAAAACHIRAGRGRRAAGARARRATAPRATCGAGRRERKPRACQRRASPAPAQRSRKGNVPLLERRLCPAQRYVPSPCSLAPGAPRRASSALPGVVLCRCASSRSRHRPCSFSRPHSRRDAAPADRGSRSARRGSSPGGSPRCRARPAPRRCGYQRDAPGPLPRRGPGHTPVNSGKGRRGSSLWVGQLVRCRAHLLSKGPRMHKSTVQRSSERGLIT